MELKSMEITSYFQVLNEKRPCSMGDQSEEEDLAELEDHTEPEGSSTSTQSLASTSKHKQGKYDTEWETEFPWVYPTDDGSGMYCRLCKRFNTRNERNGVATFNSTPCISLRKDALKRHAGSSMHKAAVQLECEQLASERTGGIVQAFSEVASTERKAALGAMKCLYWLAKNEIAHTTKYVPLLQLALELGCTYFADLRQGANATYTSERIIQEFLRILASQIESNLISQFQSSSYVALMCDESTDISVLKQTVIYGR